jgi:serine/threonine-protein kinase
MYRDVRAKGQMLPMGVSLRIAADACAGLHTTHELRGPDGLPLEVVHRDVSPQNLLITIRGTTKLIDFGVAKAKARRSEDTAAGTLKGKIEFMAPEQARGEPLDRRADVYSIGAVLYELLAGRPVRDTEDGKQLAALHELLMGAPVPPLPPYVPDIVRQIVERALAQDPTHRFATADELRRAIEQAMLATGLVATTEDVARSLEEFSRERTAKRRDVIDRALKASTDGRLAAATIVAPIGQVTSPSSQAQIPFASPSARGDFPTGPSLRTMDGASFTQPPQPSSSGKVFVALLALLMVGALGIGVGLTVAKKGGFRLGKAAPAVQPAPVESAASPAPSASSDATLPSGPAMGLASSSPSPSASSRPTASASSRPTRTTPGATGTTNPKVPTRLGPKPTNDPLDDYGF